jgi:hypothetical protein
VTALLAALVLAGCKPSVEAGSAQTKPADFVHLAKTITPVPIKGAREIPADQSLLVAPHAALKFRWVAVVSEIRTSEAEILKLGRTRVRAAPGHEFVVAWLSDDPVSPPYPDGKGTATASVVVGDRTTALSGVPASMDAIAVSVPNGSPAVLRIADAERTFSYDLRAGQRGDDAVAAYYQARSGSISGDYDQSGRVAYRTDARELRVRVYLQKFFVEPWLPGSGWAAPNRAWLLLADVSLDTDALAADPGKREFPVRMSIDVAKTFSVTLPDGQQVRPQTRLIGVSTVGAASISIVFDVPAPFRNGTLNITPDGPMNALYQGITPAITWSRPPAPGQFPLALR